MTKPPKPTFVVTLVALPHWGDYQSDDMGYRRLRAFLKCALRAWGLKCTNIGGAPEGADEEEPGTRTATPGMHN